MSALARTALRLAAVTAFNADAVIASLCAGRVYDSRMDAIAEKEAVPVIVVLTEEMEGEAWSANNGGPPFDDHCELLVEISYRALAEVDGEPVIGIAETDAECEMTLDLIEERAVDTLNADATVRISTRRISKQRSQRFIDPDSGIKMAQRLVTLTAQLKGDDTPATVLIDPRAAATPGADNHGNGTLTMATAATDQTVLAGTYAVTFTSATGFSVTDPNNYPVGTGICGAPFAGGVNFTVNSGATPFAAGDGFALVITQGPYAALPDPLRSVCNAMADGSFGAGICGQIAAALGAPSPIEFFTGADLTVAPQIELSPDQAPIGAGLDGSNPDIQATVTIPSPPDD